CRHPGNGATLRQPPNSAGRSARAILCSVAQAGMVLMLLLQVAGARADLRVYWSGGAVTGQAPRRLQQKVTTQLGISVQPLGLRLGPRGSNLDASARCEFARGGERASCVVEVRDRSAQRHAEHRAEIPFRDADDFAQTLALMVVDA